MIAVSKPSQDFLVYWLCALWPRPISLPHYRTLNVLIKYRKVVEIRGSNRYSYVQKLHWPDASSVISINTRYICPSHPLFPQSSHPTRRTRLRYHTVPPCADFFQSVDRRDGHPESQQYVVNRIELRDHSQSRAIFPFVHSPASACPSSRVRWSGMERQLDTRQCDQIGLRQSHRAGGLNDRFRRSQSKIGVQ